MIPLKKTEPGSLRLFCARCTLCGGYTGDALSRDSNSDPKATMAYHIGSLFSPLLCTWCQNWRSPPSSLDPATIVPADQFEFFMVKVESTPYLNQRPWELPTGAPGSRCRRFDACDTAMAWVVGQYQEAVTGDFETR